MASATQSEPNSSAASSDNLKRTENGLFKPIGDNIDIAWQWNSLMNPNNRKKVTCDLCGVTTSGGITRAKRHQMKIVGDYIPCRKVPEEVVLLLKEALTKKKGRDEHLVELNANQDDEDEVQEIVAIRSGKRPIISSSGSSIPKKPNVKGPLDMCFMRDPETSLKLAKAKRQTSMNDACDKETRARTIQYIARCFCRNGIAFNVVRTKSFRLMVEAIGNYGPHLKTPTYHEMRVPLLKKEVAYTQNLMKSNVEERAMYGCSIMSDAWTDRKQRTLINFLVNSPSGSMFIKSVDGSSYMKTGEKVFHLLDNIVEEIGEKNVVQVVSDNGSNYKLAGKLLEAKRKNLFWTPCAAHCIDLILEDIGKLKRVQKIIKRGISLVGFVYNHTLALNTMRKFTKKSELVRHGVTRFATTFLTLQRLYTQRNNLRRMFTSDYWTKSNLAKDRKGKGAANVVLMHTFWCDVAFCLRAMGSLVRVLRLVDNERKPAMGYICEAMDRAKEAIKSGFKDNERKYKEVWEIIDKRWECQLHHPLHAAGHFLNPEYYYANPDIDRNQEIMRGVYDTIDRLSETDELADEITRDLSVYKMAEGFSGMKQAIRQRVAMSLVEWWKAFGQSTPNLMTLAIKVLSLTCSSSGCERNWSIFEHIHSKKRSRLDHQKLQDLVFVKYNQALKERFDCRDVIDPIVLDTVDETNEWMMGQMGGDDDDAENDLVFEDGDLTWGDVSCAGGVDEPLTYTRRSTRGENHAATASSSRPSNSRGRGRGRGKGVMIEEVDEEISEDEIEEEVEEEIYNFDTSESEKEEEPELEDDDF